jgi:drug/metabolite transporter (DMT)-like permease
MGRTARAVGIAALMVGSEPMLIVLIDSLRPGGRRPGRWTIAGVVLGFGIAGIDRAAHSSACIVRSILGCSALSGGSPWAVGSLYNRGRNYPLHHC